MGHLPDVSEPSMARILCTRKEVPAMANVEFELETGIPASELLKAATDFTDHRPVLWPTIHRPVYRVHAVDATTAEVTEGSRFLGVIWARERYDWSGSSGVRATVVDSNCFQPGGTWELTALERDGQTIVTVRSSRRARGIRGRILGSMLTLAGRSILSSNLRRTLEILGDGGAPRPVAIPGSDGGRRT
jgi:hypothetical protein